jgi:serine/threonine-protein kinase
MPTASSQPPPAPRTVGRYVLLERIAAGGMATVHLGRVQGPGGFVRAVAIKRLHEQYAADPEFSSMLLDEARLAARVRHPNVVATLDVVEEGGEIFLVMEYVLGESLSRLLRAAQKAGVGIPPAIASSIVVGVLAGLHAAHEARGDRGEPLGIVHRDVSPHNVLVGLDGVPRVLDFGIAKAAGRMQVTRDGAVKGKAAYMSPEQARGKEVDRRTDVYAAGLVLWEAFAGRRAFDADNPLGILAKVLEEPLAPPSAFVRGLSPAVDAVVARAVAKDAAQRFATARDFAAALEAVLPPASPNAVGEWVSALVGKTLGERAARVESVATGALVPDAPFDTPAPRNIHKPRRSGMSALALLAVGVSLGAVLAIRARPGANGPAVPSAPPAQPPSGRPDDSAPPDRAPTSPAEAPSAAPHASASAPASASSTVRGKPVPKPAPSKPSCQPPFRVGDDGILVPKPECL